jgi:hypothetical protein
MRSHSTHFDQQAQKLGSSNTEHSGGVERTLCCPTSPMPKKVYFEPIQQQNIFDLLPIDLFRQILQYLTLIDFGIFDQSLLNHETRSHYLTSLTGLDIHGLINIYMTKELENWFLNRNFNLQILCYNNYFSFLLIEKFQQSLCHLELYFTEIQDSHLQMIGSSSSLSSASASSSSASSSYSSSYPKLTSIVFVACHSITSNGLKIFFQQNLQLEKFHLSFSDPSSLNNHQNNTSTNNNSNFDDTIRHLVTYCHHLTHLDLSNNQWFNDNHLNFLTDESSFKLKSIRIHNTDTTEEAILRFLEKMENSLWGASLSGHNFEIDIIGLQRVACSSLFHHEPEVQLMGFRSFEFVLESYEETEPDELFERIATWTDVIHRFIEYLSSPVSQVHISPLAL